MKTILTIGVIAAGVFLLFRGRASAVSLSGLPDKTLLRGADGLVYVTAPRPATSVDLFATGSVINLANSAQVIRPATPLDSIMGLL